MCGGSGSMGGGSSPYGVGSSFQKPAMANPYQRSDERYAPSSLNGAPQMSKPYSVGMGSMPPPMPQGQPFDARQSFANVASFDPSRFMQGQPFQSGQMPNANPMAAFNRPEMSKPFSMGGQFDSLNSSAMQAPQPMDQRLAYQQNQLRMGGPQQALSGAYDYSPLSAQQSEMNQQKAGTYPGATPPPGYVAPPPGPFANWMSPMMASMIGRAGAAPAGMNAYNPGNNSWGNIDWFPGYPRG